MLAAYKRLLDLFARHEVGATFAFVMAFTLTAEQRRAFGELAQPGSGGDAGADDPWLRHYWAALREGHCDGWFQPEAFEAVRSARRHEIACHGFCHRPLGDRSVAARGAEAELAAARQAAALKGVEPTTFVFPRNEVGHLGLLRWAGFIGYRQRLRRPQGQLGRLISLAEEWNVRPRLQRPTPADDGLVPIPPGYFLNWPFGARRLVPAPVTLRRWKSLLDRTADAGTVAHLWLHPHNLITAPAQADVLERVLAHAARLRDQGRLSIETQEAYCRRQLR